MSAAQNGSLKGNPRYFALCVLTVFLDLRKPDEKNCPSFPRLKWKLRRNIGYQSKSLTKLFSHYEWLPALTLLPTHLSTWIPISLIYENNYRSCWRIVPHFKCCCRKELWDGTIFFLFVKDCPTIARLTHSPYTTKKVRRTCYPMFSTIFKCQDLQHKCVQDVQGRTTYIKCVIGVVPSLGYL